MGLDGEKTKQQQQKPVEEATKINTKALKQHSQVK